MASSKVVPLTFRAIRLILDRDASLRALSGGEVGPSTVPRPGPEALLPASVVRALETALRGPSLVGGNSYRVALTADDAAALVAWCRELARVSSGGDGAVLRVAADVVEAAP
jgi:hypothetical protein